jgi:hypothetical protein
MDYFTRKGTILIPANAASHLHFVCSHPVLYPNKAKECVLLVNISSVKNNIPIDGTCLLNIGDHPFITKPSFVYYKKAEIFSVTGINQQIAEGNYMVQEDCDDEVFSRILNGFAVSDDVKRNVFKFYEKYCLESDF